MYAGLAGSLMVIYEPYVATKYLHWSTSGEVVIMSVIGGVGTLVGPMLGAGFMLYFENVVQGFSASQWKLLLGLIFVVIVIFMPGGFAELARRLWRQAGRRRGARRGNVADKRRAGGRETGGGWPTRPGRRLTGKTRSMAQGTILEVRDLSKSFGGLRALNDVNLDGRGGLHPRHHRPQRRRQVDAPQRAHRADRAGSRQHRLRRRAHCSACRPHKIIQKGIARVFQTPQIFPGLTLLENVAIAALAKRDGQFGLHVEALRPGHPVVRRGAEHLLGEVGLGHSRDVEARHLSRGDKRRLELAHVPGRSEPRLLLLDEPTAGMSRHDTNRTIDLLKQIQRTRHDQDHHRARHARRVLAGRPHHRCSRRARSSPRARRTTCAATRGSRKPISGSAH